MKGILALFFIFSSLVPSAQDRPFWNAIEDFKTQDSIEAPPKKAIVFVGSSSFRMWKDLDADFPDHAVINRGFGGSSLPHVIGYANEIIFPYKPRQVVIYCGENDFMGSGITSEIVTDRFKELFSLLRKENRRTRIVFVSIKPSPSRQHLMDEMAAANAAIREFLEAKRRTAFVNIWDAMLDKNGTPRKELFLEDMLHMNEEGYDIWQEKIAPHLK
jgi:lysophospholipase L1-like esterase